MDDVRNGCVVSSPDVKPEIVKETAATALVDGHCIMGQPASFSCLYGCVIP